MVNGRMESGIVDHPTRNTLMKRPPEMEIFELFNVHVLKFLPRRHGTPIPRPSLRLAGVCFPISQVDNGFS